MREAVVLRRATRPAAEGTGGAAAVKPGNQTCPAVTAELPGVPARATAIDSGVHQSADSSAGDGLTAAVGGEVGPLPSAFRAATVKR